MRAYLQAELWLNILSQDPTKVSTIEVNKLKADTQRAMEAMMAQIMALTELVQEVAPGRLQVQHNPVLLRSAFTKANIAGAD